MASDAERCQRTEQIAQTVPVLHRECYGKQWGDHDQVCPNCRWVKEITDALAQVDTEGYQRGHQRGQRETWESMMPYLTHRVGCSWLGEDTATRPRRCTCGFEDTRRAQEGT